MDSVVRLGPGAAKLVRDFVNELAEREAGASGQLRETIREARNFVWLACLANRDESGKIVYERPVPRNSRGISPYDPHERANCSKPSNESLRSKRRSTPGKRAVDVAKTYIALTNPKVIRKRH